MFVDLRYVDPSDGVVPPEYANSRFWTTPALSVVSGQRLPYGKVTAHLTAKCSEASPAVDLRTMSSGSVAYCPGSMRFLDVDGQWYRLSFAPDNFAGVDRYQVACTAADAKGCKTWTLTPEPSTDPADFSQMGSSAC